MGKRIASQRPAPGLVTAFFVVSFGAAMWMLRDPVGAALRTHPYFAVTELSIRGVGPFLTEDEILAWLGVSADTRVWDLSPARARARLEMHPLIEHASVRRTLPNRFAIRIRERRPQALLLLDDLYYVGRNGRVLKRFEADHDPDFAIVTGVDPDAAPGYRIWSARRALRLQRLCARMNCFQGVSEIHVDPQRGMVLYPRKPRVEVVLGWGSWREKLRRAQRTLRLWEGRTNRLARVDLRFRNQVVVELSETATISARAKDGRAKDGKKI